MLRKTGSVSDRLSGLLGPGRGLPPSLLSQRFLNAEAVGKRLADLAGAAVAAANVSASGEDSPAAQETNAAAFTFSGAAIGTAAVDRYVVVSVGVDGAGAGNTSGVTVGGIPCNLAVQAAADNENVTSIWYAPVPIGTTADVIVTLSATKGNCVIATFSVTGMAPFIYDSFSNSAEDGAGTIDCPKGGCVIGCFLGGQASATTVTWVGITEYSDDYAAGENHVFSNAVSNFSAAQEDLTVSSTPSLTTVEETACCVAFAPRTVNAFVPGAVNFSGTNVYTLRGADLTGASDGKLWSMSGWFWRRGNFSAQCDIISPGGADRPNIYFEASGDGSNFQCKLEDTSGNEDQNWSSAATFTADDNFGWNHFLMSCDAAGDRHLYINNSSDNVAGTDTDDTLNFTNAEWCVGGDGSGGNDYHGDMCELWMALEYIDFSKARNRAKFIDAFHKPVDLGADGSIPTGTAAILYNVHTTGAGATDFATNAGTGGNFSFTGTPTESKSTPSTSHTSLMDEITTAGLTTSLEICLDAGVRECTQGNGKILDLSGNGYDFFHGTAAAAGTDDPTFTGTHDDATDKTYWSFDGGDYFEMDQANPANLETWHQDGATFSAVWWEFNVNLGQQIMFGDTNTSSGAGVYLGQQGDEKMQFNCLNGGSSAISKQTAVLGTGAVRMFGCSINENGGDVSFMYLGSAAAGNGYVEVGGEGNTFDAGYSSPSTGNSAHTFGIGSRHGNTFDNGLASGSKLYCIAFWSVALTKANFDTIYAATKARFGLA
jgi:hypothetical protein